MSSPVPHCFSDCQQAIFAAIDAGDGFLPFDDFLTLALHDPHYGYYGSGRVHFGNGGDFHTAATLSPLFAAVLAQQIAPYLTNAGDVLELGAGDGTLAEQLLTHLPTDLPYRYLILETSAALAARQQQRLAAFPQVQWLTALPAEHRGFILANEVLDCVPFRLLQRVGDRWHERGVCRQEPAPWLQFATRPLGASDTVADQLPTTVAAGYQTEVSPQAAALVRTLADCLKEGCLFFADYGFGRNEYYHPQRNRGTLLCYQQQTVDSNPLAALGEKDITAHVDFTAIAEAGLAGGARFAGYVTQAQGLINGGITNVLAKDVGNTALYARATAGAHKLLAPHEMGESIKWIGFYQGAVAPATVFKNNDISHRL